MRFYHAIYGDGFEVGLSGFCYSTKRRLLDEFRPNSLHLAVGRK